MKASAEQIEFVRRHGVTHCPPDAVYQMYWGTKRRRHNFAETTEADLVRQMAAGEFHLPICLRNRDWTRKNPERVH